MSAAHPSLDELRGVDLLEELGDEQLVEWAQAAVERRLEAGAIVAEQAQPAAGLHLLLEGTIQASIAEDGSTEPVGTHVAPTWMGAIPVLTETAVGVRMQAETDVRVATVPAERAIELMLAHAPVRRRVLRQIRPVTGRIVALEQNRERLAGLGTMAAGLAHELNNPAAAAKRAAADLADALEVLGSTIGQFVESGVERAEAEELVGLQRAALAQAEGRDALAALDAADAEDAMRDALEDLGAAEPHRLAEPLAAAGLDAAWLARVGDLAGPATDAALAWVAASLTARELAAELAESTERMSSLVGAVKRFSYMDRGELQSVDVHEGLETTLTILGHKLRPTAITVRRDYDRTLPQLTVRGPELNQVWTNLLDNAIDGLGEAGTITITTAHDGDCARIDIADDGPGIPDDVAERIFDPFFTTKDVGRGTGLGLDTARRIVTERHRGSLTFDSGPEGTVFHVWLPFEATAR